MMLTNVMSVLVVEETPKDNNQGIQDGHAAVERELGDLGGRELAVSIAELDNRIVAVCGKCIRDNTVVTRFLDGVVDWNRVVQMNSLGQYQALGLFGGIRGQDELANIGGVA